LRIAPLNLRLQNLLKKTGTLKMMADLFRQKIRARSLSGEKGFLYSLNAALTSMRHGPQSG